MSVSPDRFDRPSSLAVELENAVFVDAIKYVGPPSVTDVEMRLDRVLIYDKRDVGRGDIAIVAVTADDLAEEPFTLKMQTFQDVRNSQELTLGGTGLAIYRNEPAGTLPRFLEFRILVVELDQEIRDVGKWLDEVRKSDEYGKARDALISVLSLTAAGAGALAAGVDLLVQLVAARMKANRDDQLIFVAGSYNRAIDGLKIGRTPTVLSTDYVQVTYSIRAGSLGQ